MLLVSLEPQPSLVWTCQSPEAHIALLQKGQGRMRRGFSGLAWALLVLVLIDISIQAVRDAASADDIQK